jgi:hypothetical protein
MHCVHNSATPAAVDIILTLISILYPTWGNFYITSFIVDSLCIISLYSISAHLIITIIHTNLTCAHTQTISDLFIIYASNNV